MNICIRKDADYFAPVRYVLKIIEKNRGIQFSFCDTPEQNCLIWDDQSAQSEPICLSFYNNLKNGRENLKHEKLLDESLIIRDTEGNEDLIATIFYMVNCLQEFYPNENEIDRFGRFRYTASYQWKYKKITENIVESLIDRFCRQHNIVGTKQKSTFFISHDIDTIYSSFLQDGFWALKKMKIGAILKLITFELSRKPHWKNIDRIMKINSEYDLRSTFFWLVNRGKGLQEIKNADYNIRKEQKLLRLVENAGNINGLHKSCSAMTFEEEIAKGNLKTTFNRYHFLNFLPHRDWVKISESPVEFDCSLGFAEHFGFRNSYGLAFQPFDIDRNKPHDFIEAPMNFMDVTFHRYMKMPVHEIAKTIIGFYEKYPENCDFSIVWHNTYFTDFKYHSFIGEYKKILAFIYESGISCLTPGEIIQKNRLSW